MNTLKIYKKDFYKRIGGLRQFEGLEVLDLGCGNGDDAFEISKYAKSVVGIDILRDPVWKKRKRKNLEFIVSEAEKLPFKANSFNGLFLKDVIHHVYDIEKTLKEIRRVTTKKARIILIEGNRYNPLFYIHMTKMAGHEHLSQSDFKGLVLKYFPNAKFIFFEAHFIPLLNEKMFKLLIYLERIFSRLPFLKSILSYNVAIIN